MISDLSPFHGHGGESEKMGPQVPPQRDPAALSGHAGMTVFTYLSFVPSYLKTWQATIP